MTNAEHAVKSPIRFRSLNWTIRPLGNAPRARVNHLGREYLLEHYEQYAEPHTCDANLKQAIQTGMLIDILDASCDALHHTFQPSLESFHITQVQFAVR